MEARMAQEPALDGRGLMGAVTIEDHGIRELSEVRPFHMAAFTKDLQQQLAPSTVKQNWAALRMLFGWLVTGHIIDVNPAHAVRGPRHAVRKGKTPYLTSDEARALLDSIERPCW
jgi:site-specific recombinase XerD